MAIGSFNQYGEYDDDYQRQAILHAELQDMYARQQRGMQNAITRQLGAPTPPDTPKPVPQPEPNKVLLLLGETE